MGLANIGWSGLILILVALLIIFGPSKLPEIGKAFGKSLREFKDATSGMMNDNSAEKNTSSSTAAKVEPIELKTEADTKNPESAQS